MSPSSISSVSFFCLLVLLLPAQHGASSYASYKLGSKQVFIKTPGKSSGNSQQASTVPPAKTSSSIATGLGTNKLPVVHRQSPYSPLYGLPSLTTADVLAPPPSTAATIIPVNASTDQAMRILAYSVVVSYGTPEQQFPMFLHNSYGKTTLRCKPCTSGSDDCDPAFDTSRSSTFSHVLCGSPDCPTNCSDGSVCPFHYNHVMINATFVKDVLTLAPSLAVPNFTFVCVQVDGSHYDLPEAGFLDLSRNSNSLPSRLSSSWQAPAATFSYCLPQSPSSQGFLALGGNATVGNDYYNRTSHAPLVNSSNPDLSDMYFIDVVGMRVDGVDLPMPAGTFGGGNARTVLDLGATFTSLVPDAYDALRDAFLKETSQYNNLSVPGFGGFDTCFNFTGMDEVLMFPSIQFKISNGENLDIGGDQMLYFDNPATAPFCLTCLAFSILGAGVDVFSAVIGTHTLMSTEVIYDVVGGKVSFIYDSC